MNRYNAASHAAFAGQTDPERKLTGLVVEAARLHNSIDPFTTSEGEYTMLRKRIYSVVG